MNEIVEWLFRRQLLLGEVKINNDSSRAMNKNDQYRFHLSSIRSSDSVRDNKRSDPVRHVERHKQAVKDLRLFVVTVLQSISN